ncbi:MULTISPECIES: hypothetical protein [Mycobacterium]|uniref:Uncharacterized protein n=2 Tax=Mycobacterium TaxID=1763 RepID=A0A1Y0BZ68_9MYCO|nr:MULTISPECIES: hypothetical protein [Mycobacterium]ART68164.1 hypothetical protein BTO20_05790 [Mycobacterium dioxanotrophicus]ORA38300.1 hypothetical protein BST13_05575 [Mycobacterium aquaticum]
MPTAESTYQINEREDGALVATVERPEWPEVPRQVGVAMPHPSGERWLVIVWDENAGSADFLAEDRAAALQVLDFHAALVARLVEARENAAVSA